MANEEDTMRRTLGIALLGLAMSACNQQAATNQTAIRVRGAEQERLHKLGAFDLAIALKRAIYDAGYTCKRIEKAGFVGAYKNLDMWTAHCTEGRDWAIFAGADGSAQVRDCKDVAATGLPACVIKQQPEGSFSDTR
jgi:hypothetical protein